MSEKLDMLVSQYSAGTLDIEKSSALEELARRGLVSLPEGKGAVETAIQGVNVGLLNLPLLPVTLTEMASRGINVGLEKLGAPEQVRIPVSERGLAGTIQKGISEVSPSMMYGSMQEVPEAMRPFAFGGEVAGGGIAGAGLLGGLARGTAQQALTSRATKDIAQAPSTLTSIGRDIADAYRVAPKTAIGREITASLGAGAGGGMAFAAAPESPTAQIAGTIAGAMTPATFVANFAPRAVTKLKDIKSKKGIGKLPETSSFKKDEAAKILQRIADDYGEDTATLSRQISQNAEIDSLTAAQMADSPMLTDLEATLARDSVKFGDAYKKLTEKTAKEMNDLFSSVIREGDPYKIIEAAQVRKDYFNKLLDNRVARAQAKFEESMLPAARAARPEDASIQARKALQSALDDARATETVLWKQVPDDLDVEPTSLSNKFFEFRAEVIDEKAFPSPTQAFINRVVKSFEDPTVKVTSGDLVSFRSEALRQERQLSGGANPNLNMARIMRGLADSALEDLSQVAGTQVDVARSFSRNLNDKFRKTFAADILGKAPSGRLKTEPELTLEKTMRAGGPRASVQSRQLQEAAEMGQRQAPTLAGESAVDMQIAQRNFLYDMVNSLRDPVTGSIAPRKLESFVSQNQNMIKRLGVEDKFLDISSATKYVDESEKLIKSASAFFDRKSIASQLLKADDVDKTVARIVSNLETSPSAVKELADMIKLVKSNAAAKEGLQVSVLDNIISSSILPETGIVDGNKVMSILGAKTKTGTVESVLKNSGVLSGAQISRIKTLAAQANKINSAMTRGNSIEDLFDAGTGLQKTILKSAGTLAKEGMALAGARLAAQSPMARGSGATLFFAGKGAQAGRGLYSMMPNVTAKDVLSEAVVSNPKLMAELLKGPATSAKVAKQRDTALRGYLVSAGIATSEQE